MTLQVAGAAASSAPLGSTLTIADIAGDENRAVAALGSNGIAVLGLDPSGTPVLTGSSSALPANVVALEGRLAVTGNGTQLVAYDLSTATPTTSSIRTTAGAVQRIRLVGRLALVSEVGGVELWDLSDATQPSLVATLPASTARDAVVAGDRIAVADGSTVELWPMPATSALPTARLMLPVLSATEFAVNTRPAFQGWASGVGYDDAELVVDGKPYVHLDDGKPAGSFRIPPTAVPGSTIALQLRARARGGREVLSDPVTIRVLPLTVAQPSLTVDKFTSKAPFQSGQSIFARVCRTANTGLSPYVVTARYAFPQVGDAPVQEVPMGDLPPDPDTTSFPTCFSANLRLPAVSDTTDGIIYFDLVDAAGNKAARLPYSAQITSAAQTVVTGFPSVLRASPFVNVLSLSATGAGVYSLVLLLDDQVIAYGAEGNGTKASLQANFSLESSAIGTVVTLTVQTMDGAGKTTSVSQPYTVKADSYPPTIDFTGTVPAGGVEGSSITVSGTAADDDGDLTSIAAVVNGVQVGTPKTFTGGTPSGTAQLSVPLPFIADVGGTTVPLVLRATDGHGHVTDTAPRSVTLQANSPPTTGTINAPLQVKDNVSKPISSSASDPDCNLKDVALFADGVQIVRTPATGSLCSVNVSTNYLFPKATSAYQVTFTVVATDTSGAISGVNSFTTTVNLGSPPSISSVTAPSSAPEGTTVNITVSGTDTDTGCGLTQLKIMSNGQQVATQAVSTCPFSGRALPVTLPTIAAAGTSIFPYQVVLSDSDGNTDSKSGSIVLTQGSQTFCSSASNGALIGALPLQLVGTTAGTGTGTGHCYLGGSFKRLYKWTAPYSGTFLIDTEGSTTHTVLSVEAATCNGELACDVPSWNQPDPEQVPKSTSLAVSLAQGEVVGIGVGARYTNELGPFVLNIKDAAAAVGQTCEPSLDLPCRDGAFCEPSSSGFVCRAPRCANGLDDDGNGATDYPADSTCGWSGGDAEGLALATVPSGFCEVAPVAGQLGALAPVPFTTFPLRVTGTTAGAQDNFTLCAEGSPPAPERVYAFTAPFSGTYTFDTWRSRIPMLLSINRDTCEGEVLACGQSSSGEVTLSAGDTVAVMVQADTTGMQNVLEGVTGDFEIDVDLEGGKIAQGGTCDPQLEHCGPDTYCSGQSDGTYRCEPLGGATAGFCGSSIAGDLSAVHLPIQNFTGTTAGGASASQGSCGGASSPEVTYEFTAPATGTYHLDVSGFSDFLAVAYVRDQTCQGAELACVDSASSGADVALSAGEKVAIVVDGQDGASGQFSLDLWLASGGLPAGSACTATDVCAGDALCLPPLSGQGSNLCRLATCWDGIDNDGNGLTDDHDPMCAGAIDGEGSVNVCASGTPLAGALPLEVAGTFPAGGAPQLVESACVAPAGSSATFYRWTTPGSFRADTIGSSGPTALSIRGQTCEDERACDGSSIGGVASALSFSVSDGEEVELIVYGTAGSTYQLHVRPMNESAESCDAHQDLDGDGLVGCQDPDCPGLISCSGPQ
jgi:hypothetical protein